MEIPVIVGDRLRFRIRWRLIRLLRHDDGFELGFFGHPALQVAMTPAGFEFSQIDWYSATISYKHRRLLKESEREEIEPARLLFGVASGWFGLVYVGIYLSDWPAMFRLGQLPLDIGRIAREARTGA